MLSALRRSWIRPLMTSMVILGICVATDARAAHLLSCARLVGLHPADDHNEASTAGECCSTPEPEPAEAPHREVCLEADACGCCVHEGAAHLGEIDGRLVSSPDHDDIDGLLVATTAAIVADEPFPLVRAVPTTGRPLPASRIFLVLVRLLF